MFDAIPGGGGEGAVSVTAPGECRRPSLVEANHDLVQKVWDSWARIDRQMSELPTQAKRLRTLATDLNVNGALSGDPKILSASSASVAKIRISSSLPLWTKPRR